jgi:hypothetical protein
MGAARSFRIVSCLLQIGIVACVLVIIPSRFTGMCLCNAPKELVLELVGLAAVAVCIFRCSRLRVDWVDLLLAAFLAFSTISGNFAATDRWEALRTVGISVAGVAILWSSRAVANRGQAQSLLDAAALAVMLVAITVILDALGFGYGLSLIRPGGTLGYRNSAAHFLALGIPLLILQTLETGNTRREKLALSALTITGAALLLTRSRAAWLAVLPGAFLPLAFLGLSPRRFHPSLAPKRVMRAAASLIAGLILGVCIPTQLHWTAAHPYVESLENLTESESGSGQVRLQQYRDSLWMLADHKTLGIGPGNWKILYQPHVSDNQGSVERLVWFVPSRLNSDWIAFAVERGVPAVGFLIVALAILAIRSGRSWLRLEASAAGADPRLKLVVLIALVMVIGVVGSFDAVLQLPAPTYLVFLALGALAPSEEPLFSISFSRFGRSLAMLAVVLIAVVLATYTVNEIYVSYLIAQSDPGDFATASRIAFDDRWFLTEVVWSERAIKKDMGAYPVCD